jgi:hypothetical protein
LDLDELIPSAFICVYQRSSAVYPISWPQADQSCQSCNPVEKNHVLTILIIRINDTLNSRLFSAPMSSKIVQRNSKIHGQGVFATAPIKKGEDVIEYKGKLRTHEEVDEEYGGKDTGHTFLFILNDTYVIDANIGGNVARWLNHGCAPNCQAFVIEDESGDPRKDKVVIEAIRNIKTGEELTYDYDIRIEEPITAEERHLWACRCGAPNCNGSMIKPAKRKKSKAVLA